MVSGWLHQARLIGSLQALVYFFKTRFGYNADFGMDPKTRDIARVQCNYIQNRKESTLQAYIFNCFLEQTIIDT